MSVRRSARIAERIAAHNANVEPVKVSLGPQEHNPQCNLFNASQAGCCYTQDKRPKFQSRLKKQRDPIDNLPMLVNLWEYADGIGDERKRKFCFTRYCPSCQLYWADRLMH